MQEASRAGEHAQSFVECRVPYAAEHAQLTEGHGSSSRFECSGDALVDADRGGAGFVRSLENTEREVGAVLLEFECEGGW